MPTINQIVAASYNDVLNFKRKPADQWSENAAVRFMEKLGLVVTVPGGPQFESTLDWRPNAGAAFQSTDMDSVSGAKTDVLTAAQFDPAELSVPVVWSRADEAKNPATNQKVAFVKSLLENALNSHDDLIERAISQASTNGFLGLQTIIPDSGQGNVGTIDAAVDGFWRNPTGVYAANFSDLEAKMTLLWNQIIKGTGSTSTPVVILTDAERAAGYEGTQQGLQRYIDSREANAGFKSIAFKTAQVIHSQYATSRFYFLSKAFQLRVVKNAFRDLGEMQELPLQNAYIRKMYTMLQSTTNNKSRLGVLVSA